MESLRKRLAAKEPFEIAVSGSQPTQLNSKLSGRAYLSSLGSQKPKIKKNLPLLPANSKSGTDKQKLEGRITPIENDYEGPAHTRISTRTHLSASEDAEEVKPEVVNNDETAFKSIMKVDTSNILKKSRGRENYAGLLQKPRVRLDQHYSDVRVALKKYNNVMMEKGITPVKVLAERNDSVSQKKIISKRLVPLVNGTHKHSVSMDHTASVTKIPVKFENKKAYEIIFVFPYFFKCQEDLGKFSISMNMLSYWQKYSKAFVDNDSIVYFQKLRKNLQEEGHFKTFFEVIQKYDDERDFYLHLDEQFPSQQTIETRVEEFKEHESYEELLKYMVAIYSQPLSLNECTMDSLEEDISRQLRTKYDIEHLVNSLIFYNGEVIQALLDIPLNTEFIFAGEKEVLPQNAQYLIETMDTYLKEHQNITLISMLKKTWLIDNPPENIANREYVPIIDPKFINNNFGKTIEPQKTPQEETGRISRANSLGTNSSLSNRRSKSIDPQIRRNSQPNRPIEVKPNLKENTKNSERAVNRRFSCVSQPDSEAPVNSSTPNGNFVSKLKPPTPIHQSDNIISVSDLRGRSSSIVESPINVTYDQTEFKGFEKFTIIPKGFVNSKVHRLDAAPEGKRSKSTIDFVEMPLEDKFSPLKKSSPKKKDEADKPKFKLPFEELDRVQEFYPNIEKNEILEIFNHFSVMSEVSERQKIIERKLQYEKVGNGKNSAEAKEIRGKEKNWAMTKVAIKKKEEDFDSTKLSIRSDVNTDVLKKYNPFLENKQPELQEKVLKAAYLRPDALGLINWENFLHFYVIVMMGKGSEEQQIKFLENLFCPDSQELVHKREVTKLLYYIVMTNRILKNKIHDYREAIENIWIKDFESTGCVEADNLVRNKFVRAMQEGQVSTEVILKLLNDQIGNLNEDEELIQKKASANKYA